MIQFWKLVVVSLINGEVYIYTFSGGSIWKTCLETIKTKYYLLLLVVQKLEDTVLQGKNN